MSFKCKKHDDLVACAWWSLAAKWLRIWCSCHEISEACSPKIVRKQVKLPWVEYPPMILIHYTFSTKRVNSHLMVLRNIYFLLRVKNGGPLVKEIPIGKHKFLGAMLVSGTETKQIQFFRF